MQSEGYHSERVAASGSRRGSFCDAVLFTPGNSYLVEVKSTKTKSCSLKKGLHGLVERCEGLHILPLVAVYFKSSHSSHIKITKKPRRKKACRRTRFWRSKACVTYQDRLQKILRN
ncbi:hypothetical protein GOV09_07085 [Candidatus Woesearchaeota archaeon]|nr:hypothetical protein [Candidatus Woesearchaeota archaeon]